MYFDHFLDFFSIFDKMAPADVNQRRHLIETASTRDFEHLAPMIGNTPLLEIHCTYKGRCLRIFKSRSLITSPAASKTGWLIIF